VRRRTPAPAPALRPAKGPDREELLFKAAYREHFVARDAQAALDGWDAYLRVAPQGRLALEASYDRALCLIRLARRSDAIAALTPFANGEHGEYRRREAQRLIAALASETTP
jgi:hypothetical protein